MPKTALARAKNNLAMGFAIPIIGGVSALLIGLVIADLTRTSLDIWVWVAIHLVLGTGLILGTRNSTAAFNYSLHHKSAVGASRGARNLNLILGIVWSAIVTIAAFDKGGQAVSSLVNYGNPTPAEMKNPGWVQTPTLEPLTSLKFLQDFLPALVLILIACAGIFLLLQERSRETSTKK